MTEYATVVEVWLSAQDDDAAEALVQRIHRVVEGIPGVVSVETTDAEEL